MKLIQAQQGSTGIVYAHQRKTCDWLAAKLGNAGVDAAAYHAGRDAPERSRAQAQWMEGAFDCIVATVAFGMVGPYSAHIPGALGCIVATVAFGVVRSYQACHVAPGNKGLTWPARMPWYALGRAFSQATYMVWLIRPELC